MPTITDATKAKDRIRDLNDALRKTFVGGAVVSTSGISALPDMTRRKIMAAVRGFDAFTPNNDPHGEHDFGSLEIDGEKVFFKIDYYDRQMAMHSPDASEPAVTTRVLTIMLANEY